MKNKGIAGMLAIFLIGLTLFIAPVSAFAGRGFGQSQEVQDATELDNFEVWVEAHETMLTEERFNEAVERHQNCGKDQEARELMRDAIENNDYSAWKESTESLDHYPLDVETLTEEDFTTLVEMHNARLSGDFETADELADDLGFERPMQRSGEGRGFRGQGSGMRSAFN